MAAAWQDHLHFVPFRTVTVEPQGLFCTLGPSESGSVSIWSLFRTFLVLLVSDENALSIAVEKHKQRLVLAL